MANVLFSVTYRAELRNLQQVILEGSRCYVPLGPTRGVAVTHMAAAGMALQRKNVTPSCSSTFSILGQEWAIERACTKYGSCRWLGRGNVTGLGGQRVSRMWVSLWRQIAWGMLKIGPRAIFVMLAIGHRHLLLESFQRSPWGIKSCEHLAYISWIILHNSYTAK